MSNNTTATTSSSASTSAAAAAAASMAVINETLKALLNNLTTTSSPLALPASMDVFANLTLGMLFSDAGLLQLTAAVANNYSGGAGGNFTDLEGAGGNWGNWSGRAFEDERDELQVLVPFSVIYLIIFVAGMLGNLITCVVISRNKSMHTATNYYLFNLAISDLVLLVCGLPVEVYTIWYPDSYPHSQSLCILQGLLSETSTNATVLTITSFTVERYIAICHPFRQHTMSKLSRAIRFIMAIWIVAFCLAIPQACQFEVVINHLGGGSCTVIHDKDGVKNVLIEHAFEVSSFVFFIGPMTLICVLYVLIGIKLRSSKLLQGVKRRSTDCGAGRSHISGQTRVIRMLIAVACAFFLCWAPFHAQRVMAVYGKTTGTKNETFKAVYKALTYVSGVLYFLSTCINPLLYSIMSNKFRESFKSTLARQFGLRHDYKKTHTYSALSKCHNGNGSIRLTGSVMAGQPYSQRHTNILHGHHHHQHHQHPHHQHNHQHLQQQRQQQQQQFHELTATVIVHRAPLAMHEDLIDGDEQMMVTSMGSGATATGGGGVGDGGVFGDRMAVSRSSIDSNANAIHMADTEVDARSRAAAMRAMQPYTSQQHVQYHHQPLPPQHCLIHNRCPNHAYQRHRCISVSSQATLVTTVSRNDALSASEQRLDQLTTNSNSNSQPPPPANAMAAAAAIDSPPITSPTSLTPPSNGSATVGHPPRRKVTPKTTLGSIAEKLRRGTRKVLLFTSANSAASLGNRSKASLAIPVLMQTPATASVTASSEERMGGVGGLQPVDASSPNGGDQTQTRPRQRPPMLQKHSSHSMDSARTNTISNSSLQEVDAEEFDSAELTKHMGEINNEINAMQCTGCEKHH